MGRQVWTAKLLAKQKLRKRLLELCKAQATIVRVPDNHRTTCKIFVVLPPTGNENEVHRLEYFKPGFEVLLYGEQKASIDATITVVNIGEDGCRLLDTKTFFI